MLRCPSPTAGGDADTTERTNSPDDNNEQSLPSSSTQENPPSTDLQALGATGITFHLNFAFYTILLDHLDRF